MSFIDFCAVLQDKVLKLYNNKILLYYLQRWQMFPPIIGLVLFLPC